MINFLRLLLLEKAEVPPSRNAKRTAWNKNKSLGWKSPFTADQVFALKCRLKENEQTRDLALLSLAVDSMLRASDLLNLRVADVRSSDGVLRELCQLKQTKTRNGVRFSIGQETRDHVQQWIAEQCLRETDFLFPGRKTGRPLCARSYLNLVKKWAEEILGLPPEGYATHSLRRTKASIIYAETKDVEVVRLLLGQKNTASTSHYLGVNIDDALRIALECKI